MKTQKDYAVAAAAVVEALFPPKTVRDVLQIVTALNLLNAIVKKPYGKAVTAYPYIKGMAACLFLKLLYSPMDGVEIYWDEEGEVTYFRLRGRQFSFHYVPLMGCYVAAMRRAGIRQQLWDGNRLQNVAAKLFREVVPVEPVVREEERERLVDLMLTFDASELNRRVGMLCGVEPPRLVRPQNMTKTAKGKQSGMQKRARPRIGRRRYVKMGERSSQCVSGQDDRRRNLELALKFCGWYEDEFELTRHGDSWKVKVVRYDGSNYDKMMRKLIGCRPMTYVRPECFMRPGQKYYIRRTDWGWRRLTGSRYLLLIAHYNYLTVGDKKYNLCITYGLARYLGCMYPELRFLNVLNYTRFKVRRKIYSHKDLLRVPLRSKARTLKVWLVVDKDMAMNDLEIDDLPAGLRREYEEADDYCQFFEREYHKGLVGLVGYSRFHLLPAIYKKIDIYGHYARVMDKHHKWAVYSLIEERFDTDFVYDAIWYDVADCAVVGRQGREQVKLYEMRHEIYNCTCTKEPKWPLCRQFDHIK